MKKQEYIGNYLFRKLKDCKLPYGMEYLSLVAELEEKANKLWRKYKLKTNKTNEK